MVWILQVGQSFFSVLTHSTSSGNPLTENDLCFCYSFCIRDLHCPCDNPCPTLVQFQHLAFLCIMFLLAADYPVFGAVEALLIVPRIEVHAWRLLY